MTPDFQNLDKIDAYLNDVLSAVERAKFEQELADDPALRREFDLVQDMLGGVELAGDEALKAQIGAAHSELGEEGFFTKPEARIVEMQPARQPPSFHRLTFRRGSIGSARFSAEGQTIVYSAAWDGRAGDKKGI